VCRCERELRRETKREREKERMEQREKGRVFLQEMPQIEHLIP